MTIEQIKAELTNAKVALVDASNYVSQADQQLQHARQQHAQAAAEAGYWQRRLAETEAEARKEDPKQEQTK